MLVNAILDSTGSKLISAAKIALGALKHQSPEQEKKHEIHAV
jgi:hypothetical protein